MGQEQKKYHVTNDGVVYKVDDTGEITEMGNVESLSTTSNIINRDMSVSANGIRYSLCEIEQMLCENKGRNLIKEERKLIATQSKNIKALLNFVDIAGVQWLRKLIRRFEQGEIELEPVLQKMSEDKYGPLFELATCKRGFSDSTIYFNIEQNTSDKEVKKALKANPNSPYYKPDTEMPSKKGDGGCLGVILLAIILTSTIITFI